MVKQIVNDYFETYYSNALLIQKLKKRIKYADKNIGKNKSEINEIDILQLESRIKIKNISNYLKEDICPKLKMVADEMFG
jgi:hypothetical protein